MKCASGLPLPRRLAFFAFASLAVLPATRGDAVDVQTTRSTTVGTPSAVWSDTTIWSAGQVPNNNGTTWHAIIPIGAPITQLDNDYTINRLDLTAATLQSLDAGHQLTVVNELNLDTASLRGPGTLLSQGTGALGASINNFFISEGFVLQNAGTLSGPSGGFVLIDNTSRFENLAGATFTMSKAGLGTGPALGGPNRNAGIYNLSNTSQFAMGVDNLETTATGVVNVSGTGATGIGSPGPQAGDFNVSAPATFGFTNNVFGSTVSFAATASLVGEAGSTINLGGLGKFAIAGTTDIAGTLNASSPEIDWTTKPTTLRHLTIGAAGVARFSAGIPDLETLGMSNGTLTGGGDHTITSALSIVGSGGAAATLSGAGTTTLANGADATAAGSQAGLIINQRKLVVASGATYTGIPTTIDNGGELHNQGTVTDVSIARGTTGSATFRNDGHYALNQSTSPFTADLAGNGTTTLADGVFHTVTKNATGGQDFVVNSGATLSLGNAAQFDTTSNGTTRTFDASSSITGAGNATFGRGTTSFAGAFNPGGTVSSIGGSATISSAVSQLSTLSIGSGFVAGGTLNFSGGLTEVDDVTLAGTGDWSVTGDTLITDTAEFSGGTHSGAGTTTVAAPAMVGGTTFSGRTVVFNDDVGPSSFGGNFGIANDATVRLAAGATLALEGYNGFVTATGANPGRFINAGTIDYTHAAFPDDDFLFQINAPFVQEEMGVITTTDDVQLGNTATVAGTINLTTPESRLLLRASASGVTQTFEAAINGAGSIDIDGDPFDNTNNVLDVTFNGPLAFTGADSTITIEDANVTLPLQDPPVAPARAQSVAYRPAGAGSTGNIPRAQVLIEAKLLLSGTARLDLIKPANVTTDRINFAKGLTVIDGSTTIEGDIVGDLIDRVEVTTGGATAQFGSAASGVVNIVLKKTELRTGNVEFGINTNVSLQNSRYVVRGDVGIAQNGIVKVDVDASSSMEIYGGILTIEQFQRWEQTGIGPLVYGGPRFEMRSSGAPSSNNLSTFQGNLEIGWNRSGGATRLPVTSRFTFGLSPGAGRIIGSVESGPLTAFEFELAGTQPGETYDFLDLNGGLELDGGVLDVRFMSGFASTVQASDAFTLIDADTPIVGQFANAASGQRLATTDGLGSFVVHYGAGSPHGPDNVVLTGWQAAAPGAMPPAFTSPPATQAIVAGSATVLSATVTGTGPLTYQWYRNGVAIPGATEATYSRPSWQGADTGAYAVAVSNALGTVFSAVASITIASPPANNARLLNLSTRGLAQIGDNILIPGFVVSSSTGSPQGGTKRLLIRAVGPTLRNPPYNIATALENPRMTLKRLDFSVNPPVYVDVGTNDDWMTNTNATDIADAIDDLFAFEFEDDREAALLVDLNPGQYTVFADGVANATGIAIVELYDADAGSPTATLVNISNRGFVGTGESVMIPGFVISSEGPKTLLIRVVGPTLAGAPYNVPGTMADPQLQLFRKEADGSDTFLLTQNNWGESPDAATTSQVAQSVGAFALAAGSTDAAFVVTLPPGVYTVIGTSADGTSTGVVLVEIYVVP